MAADPYWDTDFMGATDEAYKDSLVYSADLGAFAAIRSEIDRLGGEIANTYDPEGLSHARLGILAAVADSSLTYWDSNNQSWVDICSPSSDLCSYSGPYVTSYAAAIPPLAAADAVGCVLGVWNSRHHSAGEMGASCLVTAAGVSLISRIGRLRFWK